MTRFEDLQVGDNTIVFIIHRLRRRKAVFTLGIKIAFRARSNNGINTGPLTAEISSKTSKISFC